MNSAQTARIGILSGLLIGIGVGMASAQSTDSSGPSIKDPGVWKVTELTLAPWRLAGAATDRPATPRDQGVPETTRIFDNTGTSGVFYSIAQPHRVGDTISLIESACLAGPARITSTEFAFYVNPGLNAEAYFDAYCLFYDNFDPLATPVNSHFLGGFILEFRDIAGSKSYTTGPIDLTGIFPKGIPFPDERIFVDIRFCEPGSMSQISPRVTPIFAGLGPSIGSGDDRYWLDANANGLFEPRESADFGGPPFLANLYFAIDGIIETSTCPPDFNHDGTLNSQDFFDFLNLYLLDDPGADFDEDGIVSSQDFFSYLAAYFVGCE